MVIGWVLLAIGYLAVLFWLARWGDGRSALARKITSHPVIYSLALAIYCTAWTFFWFSRGSISKYMELPANITRPHLTVFICLSIFTKADQGQ